MWVPEIKADRGTIRTNALLLSYRPTFVRAGWELHPATLGSL
jgi:hypothetical protein